jgi:hypothetical protein
LWQRISVSDIIGRNELEVFDSRVLWRISVLNRGEIKGNLRKLNNKKLHNLSSSWRIRLAGHVELMLEEWNAHRAIVGKPDENTPIGIPRCRWA